MKWHGYKINVNLRSGILINIDWFSCMLMTFAEQLISEVYCYAINKREPKVISPTDYSRPDQISDFIYFFGRPSYLG